MFILIFLLIVPVSLLSGYDDNTHSAKESFESKVKKSPNYKDGKFYNNPDVPTSTGSGWTSMKEWFWGDAITEPKSKLPVMPINIDSFYTESDTSLVFSWIGHSTLLMEFEGKKILTDPVFTSNASPVPFLFSTERFQERPPIRINQLPDLDVVMISHDHFDHMDKEAIKEAHPKIKMFLVPLGVEKHLMKWGVPAEKIISHDWGDSTYLDGLLFIAQQAQHFSGRSLFLNRTLWASWVIIGKHKRIYFSGDSGYHPVFKTIGEKYGPFDMTFLDCAQYNKAWKTLHMFPEEAVQAHIELRGKTLMPLHWGTFRLSNHDWYDPVERLVKAAEEHGVSVITPVHGKRVVYDEIMPDSSWWVEHK